MTGVSVMTGCMVFNLSKWMRAFSKKVVLALKYENDREGYEIFFELSFVCAAKVAVLVKRS